MPKVTVHGVWLGCARLDVDLVFRAIINHFLASGELLPEGSVSPRCENLQVGSEGGKSKFEPALVVSFAGCSVSDGIGVEFPCHLDLSLRNQGAGNRGAKEVLGFVNGIAPNHWVNEVIGKLIDQVQSPVSAGSGRESFFLQAIEFLLLANVGAVGDDFGVLFVCVPMDEDGSIQTS